MRNGHVKDTPPSPDSPGDEFEALYQRHSREVWAMAYAGWMNADTAMDITQEAFLRLWKQYETGERIPQPAGLVAASGPEPGGGPC